MLSRPVRWPVAVAIVAVTLLAAELGARWIGPNIPRQAGSEERAYVKADQMYQRGHTDVVILGSSETAGGLIPSVVLGEASDLSNGYNAALAGVQLDLGAEWAERIVLPQLDPDVVVIGMLPTGATDMESTGFVANESTAPAYRSAFDIIAPEGLGRFGWPLRQRSGLIRHRPELRHLPSAVEGVERTLLGSDGSPDSSGDSRMDWETETDPERVRTNTAPDGEVLDYRDQSVPGDNRLAAVAFTAAGDIPFDATTLDRLVAVIRASGARPVVALAPIDRTVLEEAGADLDGVDELSRRLERWGESAGVPVLNSLLVDYPPDAFHDRQHLAHQGSIRWSTEVGRWLQDLCTLGELPGAC